MITIAITGGVATGKSAVAGILAAIWGEQVARFSADAAVHDLLTRPPIKTKLLEVFGGAIFDGAGDVDRATLRRIVFRDPPLRRQLEQILHPEVYVAGQEALAQAQQDRRNLFLYEIPLLYEVESRQARDIDLVVAASEEVQRRRLAERRGLDSDTIDHLLQSQMPLSEKLPRAQVVIWNDGTEAELEEQVHLFSATLHQRLAGESAPSSHPS